MTETELILASLTPEELDDTQRYIGFLDRSWRTMSQDEQRRVGFGSDGPMHAITALRLAVIREMTQRGGGTGWYVGEPTTGHVAGKVLDLYARRFELRGLDAQMRGGRLCQTCVICGTEQPLDLEHFPRPDGAWSSICVACNRVDHDRARQLVEDYDPKPVTPTAEERHEEIAALL